jgi:hypothetical protein
MKPGGVLITADFSYIRWLGNEEFVGTAQALGEKLELRTASIVKVPAVIEPTLFDISPN